MPPAEEDALLSMFFDQMMGELERDSLSLEHELAMKRMFEDMSRERLRGLISKSMIRSML